VFENRVLRRIFGLKKDEVMGGQGKMHNEKLCGLSSFPRTIRMTKLTKMKWAGNVA
jgi:hypothetical protein